MTALIVGGDYIKPLEKVISDRGVRRIEHWSGRKKSDLKKIVPADTRLVILLCDYICHSLAKKVRSDAERLGLPVIYCRRSVGEFCEKLDQFLPADAVIISKAETPERDAYSAFGGTELGLCLKAVNVKRLFVGGLATDYCVLNTVKDARVLGYAVVLLTDAIRPVEVKPGDGEKALAEMRQLGAQLAVSTDLMP